MRCASEAQPGVTSSPSSPEVTDSVAPRGVDSEESPGDDETGESPDPVVNNELSNEPRSESSGIRRSVRGNRGVPPDRYGNVVDDF